MFKQSEVKGIRIALTEREDLNHISLHKTFKNVTVSWDLASHEPNSCIPSMISPRGWC